MAALAAVLSLGWWLRAQVLFGVPLVPGINGAYYLVQARGILEDGSLAFPDFPLLFYLQAAVSWCFSLFLPLREAIASAVRWTDVLLPPLLAVPILPLACALPRRGYRSLLPAAATLLAGLAAVGNAWLLRMAGDFQKNAAALPLALAGVYFLYRALSGRRRRDLVLAALFFALACLTHLGVAALSLSLAGLMAIFSLASHPHRRRVLVIILGLGVTLVGALALAAWFDPDRVGRLLSVALDPSRLFANSAVSQLARATTPAPAGAPGREFGALLFPNLLGLAGLALVVIDRRSLGPAERALLLASSLTALLFASPVIGAEWSQRLAMMAFVPCLVPLTYLVVRHRWGWALAIPLTAAVLLGGMRSASRPPRAMITPDGLRELESLEVWTSGQDNLVVAVHGLEWWAAWALDTEVTNRILLAAQAWDDYAAVYVLEQKSGAVTPGSPAPPARPRLDGRSGLPAPLTVCPGCATPSGEVVADGRHFALIRLSESPVIARGEGPPDLRGRIERIEGNRLWVQGEEIRIGEDTALSRFGREASPAELHIGDPALVWGQKSLIGSLWYAEVIAVGGAGGPPAAAAPPTPPGAPPIPPSRPTPEAIMLGFLELIPRAGWGARPMTFEAPREHGAFDPVANPTGVLLYPGPLEDWLRTVVVHHSALPPSDGPHEIQQLHFRQGYADIAYHFLIDAEGTLFQGRPLEVRGAHVEAFNTGSIGVVLLGNFESGPPTAAQLETLGALIDYLAKTYGVTHLAGHRDFNPGSTECPGEYLEALLPDIAAVHTLTFGTGGYVPPPWAQP